MFSLLDRVPNVEPLLNDLEDFIIAEGLMVMIANFETITNVTGFFNFGIKFWSCFDFYSINFKDSEKYVEQLLELFNRFTKLVEEAFNSDPRFLTSRDKVFLLGFS